MSKANPWDLVAKITDGLPEAAKTVPPRQKMEVVETGDPKVGWDSVPKRSLVRYQDKTPETWTNNDVRWYYKDVYFKRYGLTTDVPIAIFNTNVSQILFTVYKRVGTEPGKYFFKGYIDYYFDRFADDEIKSRGRLTFWALTREKPLLSYIQAMGAETQVKKEAEVVVESVVSQLDCDQLLAAYRIGPKSILGQYGVIIPINFLVLKKGKSLVEAVQYVEKGLLKLSEPDKLEVLQATARWGPYPIWLTFLTAENFGVSKVETTENNPVFDCLKESK